MLHTLNRDVITRQQAQSRRLAEHIDSLVARNGELNRQLQSLIRRMDDRVQSDLRQREAEITAMRQQSFLQIGGLTGFILLLLVVSYIIIHRDANRIKRYKEKTARLISELQESAAQNEELITSRKKAMHTITHELRTPLTAIHGYAELIPKENDTEKIENYSGNIRMATQRMITMLNSLLNFFRLDSGKEQANVSPFKLKTIADAITDEEKDVQKTPLKKSYSVVALDDNEIVLNMIKDMYASVGAHCDTFSNVGDMMEAIRIRNYDFAIVDLKMPEMNGFEVLELMRSSSIGNSKEIPVIVATASGSCDEEELLTRGFTVCLFKPFAISELLATSEKCVSANAEKDELPDLTSLLAYGNKTMILDRLITEAEKDMQAVRDAGEKGDRKALDEWVHRLRSSWAVIRADKSLWELHGLLHQASPCSDEELQRAVYSILEKGNMIIKAAKEERRKSDEDICD